MSESGIAIDPVSKTVVLIGVDLIQRLMVYSTGVYTLSDFNRIATTIVRHSGAHYGARLDGVTDDEWCLATLSVEDSMVLASYLKDPAAEVSMMDFSYAVEPIAVKKHLH